MYVSLLLYWYWLLHILRWGTLFWATLTFWRVCWSYILRTNYTVSQKKTTLMLHIYNFNAHQTILVFFGRNVAKRVCYQTVVGYPTSANWCFCTTWGNANPGNCLLQSCCILCLENEMARREISYYLHTLLNNTNLLSTKIIKIGWYTSKIGL